MSGFVNLPQHPSVIFCHNPHLVISGISSPNQTAVGGCWWPLWLSERGQGPQGHWCVEQLMLLQLRRLQREGKKSGRYLVIEK